MKLLNKLSFHSYTCRNIPQQVKNAGIKRSFLLLLSLLLLNAAYAQDKSYPKPKKTKERIFYIQRNLNSNTILYDAVFNEKGYFIERNPINIYYINYNIDSGYKSLTRLEKLFAYGARASRIRDSKDYKLKLVAYRSKEIIISQDTPFKVHAITEINGIKAQLDHLYIFADNSKLWPDVKYIELFGKSLKDDSDVYEKLIINK